MDVEREAEAIDAAISQSQTDDGDDDDDRSIGAAAEDGDADYVPASSSSPVPPSSSSPSPLRSHRKKPRGGNHRPPPPDPSIARATGAKLLDDLLAKAAAYMSRTAVGAELAAPSTTSRSKQPRNKGGPMARMSEKEEDDVLLHALEDDADAASTFVPLTEQPASITGKMRAYQLEGLNWSTLASAHAPLTAPQQRTLTLHPFLPLRVPRSQDD